MPSNRTRRLAPLAFATLAVLLVAATAAAANPNVCTSTAQTLRLACGFEAHDDYLGAVAFCQNISDRHERRDCLAEARAEARDARGECGEILEGRRDLCDAVGEAAYEPPFGADHAADFVDPLEIGGTVTPNPYFPLVPGNRWVYEGTFDEDGETITETVTVTVTSRTKAIEGITCIEVRDVAEVDGVAVEVTDDWYAQDLDGNVWYCGEISQNFELFDGDDPEEPELVDVEGSWKAGRDGAKAGISLPAAPMVGDVYRQEVAWGDAEDAAEVLSVTASESSPEASCSGTCLQTFDFTPLDPEALEHKFYAPGVGLIVEVDLNTGDRVELIDFQTP